MIEEQDEVQTFDERMTELYGDRSDWEDDSKGDTSGYADEYRAFLENGCRGILTYEQAVEAYKMSRGILPDSVTEWPELDWVKREREEAAKAASFLKTTTGLEFDEYAALYLPYEPMLRLQY